MDPIDDLDFYGGLPKALKDPTLDFEIRNRVTNPDGSVSTIKTMSFNDGTGEILIPTVVENRLLSEEDAIRHYEETGESFGTYGSVEDADKMAQYLHLLHEQKLAQEAQGRK